MYNVSYLRVIVLFSIFIMLFACSNNMHTILHDVTMKYHYPKVTVTAKRADFNREQTDDVTAITITFTFTEPMKRRSVIDALTIIDKNEKNIQIVSENWSFDNTRLSIDIEYDSAVTPYHVSITKDAKSTSDNSLLRRYDNDIRVDLVKPQIIETRPDNGQDKVSTNSTIRLLFTEPMDRKTTETAFTLRDNNGNVAGTFKWGNDDKELEYYPDEPLYPSRTYTIELTTTATDLANNPIIEQVTADFTITAEFIGQSIIGDNKSSKHFLAGPVDITTYANENGHYVFVCNINKHKVIKYKVNDFERKPDSLRFVCDWGTFGTGEGDFQQPGGIAVDNDGNVYVTDLGRSKILKFTFYGDFLYEWGERGSAPGQLETPTGITIDNSGDIYISDHRNWRVQKFTPEGSPLPFNSLGGKGSEPEQFNGPLGISVDRLNNVYVCDVFNHRIQKFNSKGEWLTEWGGKGSGPGQFNHPVGIIIDHDTGYIYVSELYNFRVQIFTEAGEYHGHWGWTTLSYELAYAFGDLPGKFRGAVGLAMDSLGTIYVTDIVNNRIQWFDKETNYLSMVDNPESNDDIFGTPIDIAVDNDGNIYVVDSAHVQIKKYDDAGTFITSWGEFGIEEGDFIYPKGISIDSQGNIYVGDLYACRIQKFSPDGTSQGELDNDLTYFKPIGIAFDSNDNVYMVNQAKNKVEMYNNRPDLFNFTKNIIVADESWETFGENNDTFNKPTGIAIDSKDNVYITDSENHRVVKFNSEGTYETEWGDETIFECPTDIAIDRYDNIYITDAGPNKLQKFSTDGTLQIPWKSFGIDEEKIGCIEGVAVDNDGNIYIADTRNNRVVKYSTR